MIKQALVAYHSHLLKSHSRAQHAFTGTLFEHTPCPSDLKKLIIGARDERFWRAWTKIQVKALGKGRESSKRAQGATRTSRRVRQRTGDT